MTDNEGLIEHFKGMTLAELSEFITNFEGTFGVSASTATEVLQERLPAEPEAEPEPTELSVVLTAAGAQKIQVIKEVRALTGLGLKEAKDLVDGAPAMVIERMEAGPARVSGDRLRAVGASVELKPC